MVGAKVKSLREARCWSQAHLAQASCVNIRTIQRLEAGEPCAHETLLAIAAALEVDVRELNGGGSPAADPGEAARPPVYAKRAAAIGALAAAPCLLFVAVNAMKQWLGIAAPYDALASAGARLMSFETFNLVSPVVFFGGALTALVLCAASQISPRVTRREGVVSIAAIDVRLNAPAMVVLLLSLFGAGALFLYALAEQIASIAPR